MGTQKGKMLKELMVKAIEGDVTFVSENVTEEVKWNMVGKQMVIGKEALKNEIESWGNERFSDLQLHHIITHGITASVNGKVNYLQNNGEVKEFSFCHVLQFNKFKDGVVKEITSYII